MAYNRSKRFSKLILQTPAGIGPGTYDLSDPTCPPRLLAEKYPFLSGAKRQTLSVSNDAQRQPGPGAYDIKDPQKHIPGGVSIDFTDARFKYTIHEGPGPIYDVSEDLLKPQKTESQPYKCRGPVGKLWLTRPPRSPLPQPTSVPGKLDIGYVIDEYGVLKKNPPVKHVSSCFYNVPREETCYTTLKYKGNFWSRMTSRTDVPPSSHPGPGYYEHETKKTAAQIRDERIREAKRGTARQLRFLDILSRRKLLENFPAPNSYNIKGNFDKFLKIACKCDSYLVKLPPFGQSAKRFAYKKEELPGPGTYDPKNQIKCVTSIYNAPFGSFTGRFHKITVEPGPAPSDYHMDVGNLAYESQKRFKQTYKQSYPRKPFKYISTFHEGDEDSKIPITPKTIKNNGSKIYHAAFKSKTARFPAHKKVDVPDPGAYDVLTAFKANRDKCDYLSRRLPAPFGSRASRFPKTLREDVRKPDPTTYDVAGDISSNIAGGVISFPLRDPKKSKAPGPTCYCIHPYVSSSVLKKSFNSTLSKPKIIKMLDDKEKRAAKTRSSCEKKKLRWFVESSNKYKHCPPPCVHI